MEKEVSWLSSAPQDSPYKRYLKLREDKPIVPGKAASYQFLPPRGHWGGLVKKGQVIRVVDLEGQQCFDTIIYDAYDLYNRLCCSYCWAKEGKWDNWKPGDGIWSRQCDKLAMITEDTSEGHHAFAGGFCSPFSYGFGDGIPNIHSCHDNFVAAMRMAGFPEFTAKDIDWGSCISFFMYIMFNADGTLGMDVVSNKPGDYIDLMAERDIIVTLSNCPNEIGIVNNWNPTSMYAVVFTPNNEYIAKADALRTAREADYKEALGLSEEDYKSHILRD